MKEKRVKEINGGNQNIKQEGKYNSSKRKKKKLGRDVKNE